MKQRSRILLSPRAAFIAAAAVASAGHLTSGQLSRPLGSPVTISGQSRFDDAARGMSPSQRAGRTIWFNATAGNHRFFTYVFQQRLGVLIDWYGVLGSLQRDTRFDKWGIINDPDCCTPGTPECPKQSLAETYGFDYCPGDDDLLQFVGKPGYLDPACRFQDAPLAGGAAPARQNACDLEFGTSTGALGFRKFPNPRFDRERWRAINGSLDSWTGYGATIASSGRDARVRRLLDGSIEPPYLIGMSCGACHIAFNPLKPPRDPANPEWEHIDGLVGNQYSRVSQILVSGMSRDTLEWQVFAHARPGTADTSAIPNDQVNNPGTMNPIMNLDARPTFEEVVVKWRNVSTCAADIDPRTCWCDPDAEGKCWRRASATERVHHILKGGEDSIGLHEALQRVYFNIGSCSEQCWVNHITDIRQADPAQRGFGQTPLDIGQCRRDCPNFRAIEDRLAEVAAFLAAGRPFDLYRARGLRTEAELDAQLDREFGAGSVARGRTVFAGQCARCHSSQPGPFDANTDFRAATTDRADLRKDFLSTDAMIPATRVGTQRSRALHSNHMKGHVWEEYGSETLRARPQVQDIQEPSDGGRGYYHPISLLSVWAFAPFMHNNAIGPEVCGGRGVPGGNDYRSPYVIPGTWRPAPSPPACVPFDPSVEGRYALFKASMTELLYPDRRVPKIALTAEPIVIDGPTFRGGDQGFHLQIPAGIPAALIGNLRHKDLVADLVLAKTNLQRLRAKYLARYDPGETDQIVATLRRMTEQLVAALTANPGSIVAEIGREHLSFMERIYSNSTDYVENAGHTFGSNLSPEDKRALLAFLSTL